MWATLKRWLEPKPYILWDQCKEVKIYNRAGLTVFAWDIQNDCEISPEETAENRK